VQTMRNGYGSRWGVRIEDLQAFEAVVRRGTFTRAAQELYLAQPSLSRRIAALESELGAPLLDRGHQGAVPTEAGTALLPIARRILADADSARLALDELAGLRRGRVRLGAPPTVCASLVADVLAEYVERYPGVELEVSEAGSLALVQQLQEGELDLAFVVTREGGLGAPGSEAVGSGASASAASASGAGLAAPGSGARPSGAELIPLLREQLAVISSAQRTPPLPAEVTLAELARLPLVAPARSYDLRAATDAAFAARGLSPRIVVEGSEMDAVLRFVERGIGVAVVPAMLGVDRPGLRWSRLVRPELDRTVTLARRAGAVLPAAAREMERLVDRTVAAMERPGVLRMRR
jgi:DNA-binding transcriptional LysR family regulator